MPQEEKFVELRDVVQEGGRSEDASRDVTWAGCGVGRVHEELPASELLEKVVQETCAALRRSAALLGDSSC